jgi:cell wall-associated NlpC family hydrolase
MTADLSMLSALSSTYGSSNSSSLPTVNTQPEGLTAVQARIAALRDQLGLPSFADALQSAGDSTSVDDSTATDSSANVSSSVSGDQIVDDAKQFLGVPYVWGGTSPSGFDCSGLVQYVYGKEGINLPRVAEDQANAGTEVSAADARAGDLVYFGKPAHHIGIYLGNGMMLDAPHTGAAVRVEKVWSDVSGYRRVIPDNAVTSSNATSASTGSSGSLKLPAAGQRYAALINSAAKQAGIDPALLGAVAWTESNFNPNAVSPAGAVGIVQLMPATARGLGVNASDPAQALAGGAHYLKNMLDQFGGNTSLALAAYNAGPTAVRQSGGVPPYAETQNYVRTVIGRMSTLRGSS